MSAGTHSPPFGTLHRIARMMQLSQAIALALLLVFGALLWRNIADFRNADALVDHTHEVQEEIDRVRASVMLGGLALRNYAISPRPEFLERLARTSAQSRDATERLQALVQDNPSQTTRAREVQSETTEILGWYGSSSVIAQRDGAAALQTSLAARVNIDASQRLRELLDVMDNEERLLLDARRDAREAGFQSVKRWSAAIGLVFVLFTAGAIVHAGRLVGLGESRLKTLHDDAEKDPLTGLANRRAIDRAAQAQAGRPMAVISFDLDLFKPVNDRHGHAAGDQVLRTVAARLQQQSRHGDTVARTGGDEFVILLPGLADVKVLEGIAARVRSTVGEPIDFDGVALRVGASVGYACSDGSQRFEQLAAQADAMSYEEKKRGKVGRV
nr:diguanylate cyclase [Variovorax boronicumulans]